MGANDNEDFEAPDEAIENWDRHQREIHELIEEYQEDHDLGDEAASRMLMSLALNLQMTSYALGVDKPSATGLKLELDRFKREIDALFRDARKNAEEFISTAKRLIEAAALDEEDEDTES